MCNNNTVKSTDLNMNPVLHSDKNRSVFSLDIIEKEAVRKAMEKAGGNISDAAKLLQISRTTLYSKIKKHDL